LRPLPRGCAFLFTVAGSCKRAVTDVAPVCTFCHLFFSPFPGSPFPPANFVHSEEKKTGPGFLPAWLDG